MSFALPEERPAVMGVLNVTPDSFSDGGSFFSADAALERAAEMLEEGADLIDVGGESTRPGAEPVPASEELARVLPVVRALAAEDVPVSIDTSKPEVAREALAAGAVVLNDVYGLSADGMLQAAADAGATVCIMHMQGEPRTMQANPTYADVVTDVLDWLLGRAEAAEQAGIRRGAIWIDPGIGFGKTLEHNLSLLKATGELASSGYPVLIGASRKSFIGTLADEPEPRNRVPGSLAAALYAAQRGARILRVHDVGATVQALSVLEAILDAE